MGIKNISFSKGKNEVYAITLLSLRTGNSINIKSKRPSTIDGLIVPTAYKLIKRGAMPYY
jgi:hypothetical protein